MAWLRWLDVPDQFPFLADLSMMAPVGMAIGRVADGLSAAADRRPAGGGADDGDDLADRSVVDAVAGGPSETPGRVRPYRWWCLDCLR